MGSGPETADVLLIFGHTPRNKQGMSEVEHGTPEGANAKRTRLQSEHHDDELAQHVPHVSLSPKPRPDHHTHAHVGGRWGSWYSYGL